MALRASTVLTDEDHFVTLTLGGSATTVVREATFTVFAPDAPGDYPVIIYSHGHLGGPDQGAGVTAAALADQGYIVIAPTHLDSTDNSFAIRSQFPVDNPVSSLHRAADLQFALDQAPALTALLPPGYTPDLSRVAVAGHSHGAFTAGLLAGLDPSDPAYDIAPGNPYGLSAIADPRIDALVLYSPQGQDSTWAGLTDQSWNNLTAPAFVVTGTEDFEPGDGAGWETRLDILRRADSGPLYAAIFDGATHNEIGGRNAPAALTESITELVDRFLGAHLDGDTTALAALADPNAALAEFILLAGYFERAGAAAGGAPNGQGAISGGSGADTLFGLQTDDIFISSAGADTIDGGAGLDTGDYAGSAAAISINLETGASIGGDSEGDVFLSVEGLKGSAFGDQLTGNTANNRIDGGLGADTLSGGVSADTINGGLGADVLDGGTAFDTLDYSDRTDTGVNVNVINGVALTGGFINSAGFYQGGAQEDAISNFENILGTNLADRLIAGSTSASITGQAGDDFLFTFSGNDTLSGGDGNDFISTANSTDQLFGENGNDTLNGGTGTDMLNGGANTDTADYSDRTGGVSVNLVSNTAITGGTLNSSGFYSGGFTEDSLVSIEAVFGSAFGDRLVAGNFASRLEGRGGNDNISGQGSNDTLIGGAGNDTLGGAGGNDTFEFASGFGADRITDFVEGASVSDVIRLVGLGTSFDSFAEVIAAASQSGADVIFNFGGGNTITVLSATVAGFAANDFSFG